MALIVACRFGPKKNDTGGGGKLSAKRAFTKYRRKSTKTIYRFSLRHDPNDHDEKDLKERLKLKRERQQTIQRT
jgi:hypothetical protein